MQVHSTLTSLSVPIGLSFAISLLSNADAKVVNKEVKPKEKNQKKYKSKKVISEMNTRRMIKQRTRRVLV